ncbi:MAG: sigma-70 family RNA polymerase sigma factor [Oscillospiraceae bacterium]|nr:sigma-70 family RNA polymerase sigma factor [Oscillospiraceae bacterium]
MSRDEFIERNLPLVHSLAKRFRGKGVDYDDLFSAGCLGLVKAYDNFDSGRGLCFSTYAVPVILGEIKRLFRDGGAVKLSRSLKELAMKAMRISDEIAAEGREPRISEIAARLEVSPEEAAEAIAAGAPPASLTAEEKGESLDVPQDSGEETLIDRLALEQCLNELCDEDRKLIMLRYFRNMTQAQTAGALGTTQVQVSRRERRILASMREKMA